MFNFLNTRLRTPLQRAAFVFATSVLILVALRLSTGTVWQFRLAALVPCGVAVVLLIRFRQRWRTAMYGLIRWEIRLVRSWYAYSKRPTIVEALHLLGIALVLLSMMGLAVGLINDIPMGMVPALVVFAVAGVCELTVWAKRVLKLAWAQTVGKILSLSLGVMLTAVTVSLAKATVHSLAHVDPKYLTEFTTVVAAALSPLVYLGAASTLLLLWAGFQMLLLALVFIGSSLLIQTKPLLGDRMQNRVRVFWYRIRTGRRPPGGIIPAAGFMPQHEVSLIGSVVSKIAVVWALALLGEGVTVIAPKATQLMVEAMVKLEYRPNSACRNIDSRLGVVYMDDGNVSVARFKGNRYEFAVEKCEYGGST